MSDDHSANAISCYNSILSSVFSTPNMDRIADEGCRMEGYCATNAICTPARATIMTGQYGHINGVRTLDDDWNPNRGLNLAKLLQGAGYQTSLVGKWHLGCQPEGFDYYNFLSNGKDKVGEQGDYIDPVFMSCGDGLIHHKGYVTSIITELSTNWLENRDKDKPFFMMCHHKAPHDFWKYDEKYEHMFDGVEIPMPDSLFENKDHRDIATREYGSSVTPRSKVRSLYECFLDPNYVTGPLVGTEDYTFEEKGIVAYQKYLKDYLRTVASIDESVGCILDLLEKEGTLDDTIIIYTSDQGMFLGEHDYQDKRWSFEESIKTPLLVRYPKEIAPGTVSHELMSNIDIAPTLLKYAGVDVPEEMQGICCNDMIAGKEQDVYHNGIYFRYWMHRAHTHDNPAHYGIRTKEYKLTFYYGMPLDASGELGEPTPPGFEMYDLVNDPFELHNIYNDEKYSEARQQLLKDLEEIKAEYGDTDLEYPELAELYKDMRP